MPPQSLRNPIISRCSKRNTGTHTHTHAKQTPLISCPKTAPQSKEINLLKHVNAQVGHADTAQMRRGLFYSVVRGKMNRDGFQIRGTLRELAIKELEKVRRSVSLFGGEDFRGVFLATGGGRASEGRRQPRDS